MISKCALDNNEEKNLIDPMEDSKKALIFESLHSGKIKEALLIIEKNKDMSWVDYDLYHALFVTTIKNSLFLNGKETIDSLLSPNILSNQYKDEFLLKQIVIAAAMLNKEEYVDYLLGNYIPKHMYQNTVDQAFVMSCSVNSNNMPKFLLTNKKLYRNANIHTQKDYGLILFTYYENMSMINYLTTSNEIDSHIFINTRKDSVLKIICEKNNIEILDYILSQKEYKNIFINDNKNILLHKIYKINPEIVEYIMISKEIEITHNIKGYLESKPNLMEIIQRQKLYQKLLNNTEHIITSKKLKTKI